MRRFSAGRRSRAFPSLWYTRAPSPTPGEHRRLAPRVVVDPNRDPVRIPAPILHEMMNHALATDPEECCGLIVGDSQQRFRRLVRCQNKMTEMNNSDPRAFPRDNRSGFYMDPLEVETERAKAEETGAEVTAVYHSHVGAGAYLSELDLEHAEHELFLFPRADWIVLGVADHRVSEVGLFRRADGEFNGHLIESVLP